MSNTRVWLFRFLLVIGAGLLVAAWFLPWWRIDVILVNNWAVGHPWGLETDPFVKGFSRRQKCLTGLPRLCMFILD